MNPIVIPGYDKTKRKQRRSQFLQSRHGSGYSLFMSYVRQMLPIKLQQDRYFVHIRRLTALGLLSFPLYTYYLYNIRWQPSVRAEEAKKYTFIRDPKDGHVYDIVYKPIQDAAVRADQRLQTENQSPFDD